MLRKYFRYILLSVFFTAVLLIVFLQFNSNRSINQLINGNENLMAELRLKNALQELQTAIVTAENRVKEAVIENEIDQLKNLQQEVAGINTMLQRLDSMINDKNTDALLLKLQEFVKQKTNFNYSVLDTFSASGKRAAEKLIDRQAESHIIDSIKAASQQISDLRQQTVTALTLQADADGTRAKSLGTTLAILAALAAVFAFGYVSNRVRIQGILIAQLNESEKKAREAVVIKENFMANMSHEIRTPLNAILGFTNLLQRKKNDEETQQYINAIQRSGENLLGIVNDVLDFSKIEAGMLRIESAPFSISGLLHSVITMFKVKLAEKNIEIRHTLDESIPDTLEGDASRLTQILVNLIGNAVKFTTEGYIHITAKAVNTDKEKVWVKFSVADTGIGIDSAKQTTIFERFQQADSNASRKFGGTGLGLSIAKELVELQQGTIGVSSLPGKGSTFYFTIPYHISSEQFTKPILAANPGLPPHSNTHIRILVAEDNEMNQKLLQHLLSNWHLNFTIVNNGAEAVELLQQKHFDLILMDIQMPEMDGYTAARVIRQELQLQTPIIAMTAHALAGEREKCLSFGMNEYISKPVSEQNLYNLVMHFTPTQPGYTVSGTQATQGYSNFQYINLSYIKEVSNGNTAYEKEVTVEFIESIPAEMEKLEYFFITKNYIALQQTAHNLKTTVGIMGLLPALQQQIDTLEHNTETPALEKALVLVREICSAAVEEAAAYLAHLHGKAEIN